MNTTSLVATSSFPSPAVRHAPTPARAPACSRRGRVCVTFDLVPGATHAPTGHPTAPRRRLQGGRAFASARRLTRRRAASRCKGLDVRVLARTAGIGLDVRVQARTAGLAKGPDEPGRRARTGAVPGCAR